MQNRQCTDGAIAQMAFDEAPIGMAIVSVQNLFLHVNRAFCRFIGYSRRELLGMTIRDITFPADWPSSRHAIRRLRAGVAPIQRFEKRYVHKSGKVLWGALRVRLIFNPSGRLACTLAQVIDITERKRMELELRAAQRELERKVAERTAKLRSLARELTLTEHRERERIAGVLHDDLQQLLASASYNLGALPVQRLTAEERRALRQVQRALARSLALTRTLGTGLRPPFMDQAAWGPLLGWLAADARDKFGLTVAGRADGAPEIETHALREFVCEAVRELLFNVAKHARVKAAQVRVRPAGAGQLSIMVRDRGAGFDLQQRKRGRTLGLFTIRERAQELGGRLEVRSRPGRGTCVTLTLPLR